MIIVLIRIIKIVEDGEIMALSKGLHLYDYTWELASTVARVDAV